MDRDDYTDESYTRPHVPPATPPVIDANADADDAARLAMDSGDSDSPGSRPSSFDRAAEDEELQPGGAPIDAEPDEGGNEGDTEGDTGGGTGGGDTIDPQSPDEFGTGGGDTIDPGGTPAESEPTAPPETPLPPD